MNSETKAKWVEALRSGKYKQGQFALRRIQPNGTEGHCCLGVLLDIVEPLGWKKPVSGAVFYVHNAGVFSPGVGFTVGQGLDQLAVGKLMCANDRDDKSFAEIADMIEEAL